MLATLPDGGGEVRLDSEQAAGWLRAVNDARLLLGARLELNDDTDLAEELTSELADSDSSPRAAQLAAYGYLSEVQESLVEAVTGW